MAKKDIVVIGASAGGLEALRELVVDVDYRARIADIAFTCPECNGVLTEIREERILRLRCHTGHAFSSSSLLASVTESIEDSSSAGAAA